MSPRPRAPRGQLDAALKQLDAYIASGQTKPGVLNALTKKIDVFQRLHERELDANAENLKTEVEQLREQVAKYSGIDPDGIQSLTAEINTTKIQHENIRASNRSLLSERDDAQNKLVNVTTLLKWITTRENDDRRLPIALDAFVAHGKDSKLLVDMLLGTGTTEGWLQISVSRTKLIERYRENKNARDPEGQQAASFCKVMLAKKFDTDIDRVLAEQTEATRQQDVREAQRHQNAVFERERMIARQRRDLAIQAQLHSMEE